MQRGLVEKFRVILKKLTFINAFRGECFKQQQMKRLLPLFFTVIASMLFSCTKEYSLENSTDASGNGLIVGTDCRISKIAYTDTANGGTSLGAMTASINNVDIVTNITVFDSVSFTIDFISNPLYAGDTVFINADEYFLVDLTTKRIRQLHALTDPTDPFSTQYEVNYFYNANGYLTQKFYSFTGSGFPFYLVNYTYSGAKLTHMSGTDLITNDLVTDADISYYGNIIPQRFLYLFPDEQGYPYFSQFYNFGVRPSNAPKTIVVRNYDPGNVVRDSTVSAFSNYMMSRDNYVLSVQMTGDDLQSIPAVAGKLSFSYKCK